MPCASRWFRTTLSNTAGWAMGERLAFSFGRSPVERLTDVVERAARREHVEADVAELIRTTALRRGRMARLATAVTDLLEVVARAREDERRRAYSAVQSMREPLTSVRAQVQVLCQIPDLAAPARAALLADLDGEVARLSAELDALAVTVGRVA